MPNDNDKEKVTPGQGEEDVAGEEETPSEGGAPPEPPTEPPPSPETITVEEADRRREQALADQRAQHEQDMEAMRQQMLAGLPDEEAVALAESKIQAALLIDTRAEFPEFDAADLTASDWESEESFRAAAQRSHEKRAAAKKADQERVEAIVSERVAAQVGAIRTELGLPAAAPAGAPPLTSPPTGEATFEGLTFQQVMDKADQEPGWFELHFARIRGVFGGG